jgi:hypothetical protein
VIDALNAVVGQVGASRAAVTMAWVQGRHTVAVAVIGFLAAVLGYNTRCAIGRCPARLVTGYERARAALTDPRFAKSEPRLPTSWNQLYDYICPDTVNETCLRARPPSAGRS